MKSKLSSLAINLSLPVIVALFNLFIILFPREILAASKEGVALWFNDVLPSLLPFIIGANILIGLGVVSFIGTLLEPLMYPLFKIPGCGAFALVAGITSGYPMGAKITAELREQNELSRDEAQRLASFSNNSGPLFILGAVAVSMFGSSDVGYLILISHYTGAIATGLIFRNYHAAKSYQPRKIKKGERSLFRLAVKNMLAARRKDGRNFGRLLGDSVKDAMETILLVGGFIILFCVIVRIFAVTGLLPSNGIYAQALSAGFVEMTNGVKILSQGGTTKEMAVAAAALISFGGLSVLAQSASFFAKTDISLALYALAKLIHAAAAVCIAILLSPFFSFEADDVSAVSKFDSISLFDRLLYSSAYFSAGITAVLLLTFFIVLWKKFRYFS